MSRCAYRVNRRVIRHDQAVRNAVFSPDGERVATAGLDGIARIWDALTGEPLTPRLAHKSRLLSVAFTPSGDRLLTGDMDGIVKLWTLPLDRRPLLDVIQRAQFLSGHKIDETGGLVPLSPSEVVDAWRALQSGGAESPQE